MKQWGARPSLDGERFEVVVVGGGINGVAIARECALAGKRTLLVEQHDFASGTTSRSTRIIHGGLRYLEHGEIALVRQSLRERQRLLCERRHLVRPFQFLLALPTDRAARHNALEIRFGLWLYRRMAGTKLVPGDGAASIAALEKQLDAGRRWAIFSYDDAQCEFPERLVAEWLTEAMAAGAIARNYTEALEVELRGGRATAVVLRDVLNDAETRVETANVINAAGPWVGRLCGRSGIHTAAPLVGGVRGSHLVLARFAGAPDSAVFTEAVDGRPIFLVPWNGQLLVGTTEVRDDGDPARAQPAPEEVEYLLDSLQRLLPGAQVGSQHIRCAFAGVRPLPFAPHEAPATITRRHLLHDHAADGAAGVISVIGGKLTTAAALARECARRLGFKVAEPGRFLGTAPCDGVEPTLNTWAGLVAAQAGTSLASARAIAEWHGRRALAVAGRARNCEALRQTLCPHTDHVVAEAVEAAQSECAITLSDILLRRVPIALGACWSPECSRVAARRIGPVLGWSDRQTTMQRERFEQERAAFLCPEALKGSAVAGSRELPAAPVSDPSERVA